MEINGVINVYKEAGFTSHDVVAKLRGILHQKKIGHTGTLDPQAEGVLPVCLGTATKLCDMLTDRDKEYEAVLHLGIITDTQDMTGQVLAEKEVQVSEEEVRAVIRSFQGEQQQIPPMYSALKQNGKKLYELAREGIEVERKPRTVHFYEIEVLSVALPLVKFRVRCSKGTYIRTLCHDIGEKLGCGGCMEHLLRTRVERFEVTEARKLQQIQNNAENGTVDALVVPVDQMFDALPRVTGTQELDGLLHNGNPVEFVKLAGEESKVWEEGEQMRIYDSGDCFIGVFCRKGKYAFPVKIFYRKDKQ